MNNSKKIIIHKNSIVRNLLISCVLLLTITVPAYSQSTSYEKNVEDYQDLLKKVDEYGSCKTLAFSENHGLVAICGKNTIHFANISESLYDDLKDYCENDYTIRDISISDNGLWYILADNISFSADMYSDVIETTKELISNGETIISISFNDYNQWAIVTDKSYTCSSSIILDFVNSVKDSYGVVSYIYIGNDNIIVTCDNGVNWTGNVNEDFFKSLQELDFKPTVIKYFFNGSYSITNPDINRGSISIQY